MEATKLLEMIKEHVNKIRGGLSIESPSVSFLERSVIFTYNKETTIIGLSNEQFELVKYFINEIIDMQNDIKDLQAESETYNNN